MHFADPTAQAVSCGITATVLPVLEGIAATWGISLAEVERLYAAACGEAAARGLSQQDAEAFGISRARTAAMRMAQERGQ